MTPQVLSPKASLSRTIACPDCNLGMTPYSCDGSILYKCNQCHGLWLPHRRLGNFTRALRQFDFSELELELYAQDENKVIVSSCTKCNQVLDEFHYAYNSGVHIYRCARCQGQWLPLRQMVKLMQTLKLGQSLEEDIRGYLAEMRSEHERLTKFFHFTSLIRNLMVRL